MSWKPLLHKILRGDQAGFYLPYARSRLRALVDLFGINEYFSEKRSLDNYTIEVQQIPPYQYIRITQEGGLSYEFFTSDHVLDTSFSSPGEPGFVWGSATRAGFTKGASSPRALSSSMLVPTSSNPWIFRDGNSTDVTTLGFYTKRAWQDQKFFEHAWHANNDGKSLVTSCQAQAPGLAGQCNWMSPYNFRRIANAGSMVSDFGLDVWPTLYTKSSTVSGAPQLDQEWVWYRRAAVQTVGGRQFFIHTDNYGRFQVYPVKDYSLGNTVAAIVPIGSYKQYTPPYPGWATVPDPSDYTKQVNDWLWRFNKDATKCVSVPYHSDYSSGFAKTLYNQQFLATLTPAAVAASDPAYANAIVAAHEDTPGLVEFGIAINVTGDGDLDFDVTFTLLRNSYFADSGRFFFDAAYFLKDVENIGIGEDTLITAEVKCLYPNGYRIAASADGFYLDQTANVQGSIVINANDASLVSTQKFLFPTFPGGNAQFFTLSGYENAGGSEFAFAGPGSVGGDVHYIDPVTHSPTVLFTGSAGPAIYTPPSPPFTPGTYGAQLGFLYALELSTLSLCYEVDDQVAGTGFVSLVAYGTEVYRDTFPLGYTHPASPWPVPDTVMPSARWYQYLLDSTLNTEWGMGFSVHPLGHWAFGANAAINNNPTLAGALDWISVKEADGTRSKYLHKDLFNKAFGQARDYSFYDTAFPGEALWDQGSFRTQGIWVTFR